MSESVEQAATVEGWKARATREAAAIIAEAMPNVSMQDYPRVVTLVAVGWLQGANFGAHDTLGLLDAAFDGMRDELGRRRSATQPAATAAITSQPRRTPSTR